MSLYYLNVTIHVLAALLWLGGMFFLGVWATRYGHALAIKLTVVLMMIGLSAVHDFVHGPAAGRHRPGSPATRHRRQAAWLARTNALLGIILVYAAVRLARGGQGNGVRAG